MERWTDEVKNETEIYYVHACILSLGISLSESE